MKKILALLLLVSAVVGMTMPAMATSLISKESNNNQDATNVATSTIAQTLENHGALVNENDQIALGGDAEAKSKAKGSANAQDQSSHDVGNGEEADDNVGGLDTSGAANVLSGNAVSSADADAGDAENGDNFQINAVVQIAVAEITTEQEIEQSIDDIQPVDIDADFDTTIETETTNVNGNGLKDDSTIIVED